MNGIQALATALAVLGGSGVVSMLMYRAALYRVEVESLPGRLVPRALWWRDHVGPVLRTSMTLLLFGLVVLTYR